MWSGKYHLILKKLHSKHGPVVRIGPNLLDLDYPELIKTMYGTNEEWRKVSHICRHLVPVPSKLGLQYLTSLSRQTAFYHNNAALVNGRIVHNMFSAIEPADHARIKRPVAKYYSSSSVLALEPHVDEMIDDLCQQLERRFVEGQDGTECDLGEWIAYCARPPSISHSESWFDASVN